MNTDKSVKFVIIKFIIQRQKFINTDWYWVCDYATEKVYQHWPTSVDCDYTKAKCANTEKLSL